MVDRSARPHRPRSDAAFILARRLGPSGLSARAVSSAVFHGPVWRARRGRFGGPDDDDEGDVEVGRGGQYVLPWRGVDELREDGRGRDGLEQGRRHVGVQAILSLVLRTLPLFLSLFFDSLFFARAGLIVDGVLSFFIHSGHQGRDGRARLGPVVVHRQPASFVYGGWGGRVGPSDAEDHWLAEWEDDGWRRIRRGVGRKWRSAQGVMWTRETSTRPSLSPSSFVIRLAARLDGTCTRSEHARTSRRDRAFFLG